MFKKKITSNEQIQKMEAGVRTLKVIDEFFGGGLELRAGESTEDFLSRSLGITRQTFDETLRLFQSIVAGRVIRKERSGF